MTATIDTNILVYAANKRDPLHERAKRLLDHIASSPALVTLLWPTILGYLRITTSPSIFPTPLSYEEATTAIDALLALSHVRVVGEADDFWTTYRRVADDVRPGGNLVSDAHLVGLMQQHGVSAIWTRDRDFRKFDGITAKDPFADRYAEGFD